MKILFISNEVSPFAKVGGLADVAGSLPKALQARKHDVRVAMPGYRMLLQEPAHPIESPEHQSFTVSVGPRWEATAQIWETAMGDVPVYLVAGDPQFDKAVDSASIYQPGYEQHLFFARAVLELCKTLDWIPDVVHANDWHTGLVPVLMREGGDSTWDPVANVFTIHNLAYQGEFGAEVLDRAGLPGELFNHHQLEAYGQLNFLKAGCAFSDRVNTVSERYANEIQTPEFGCRLDGLMRHLYSNGKLSGILNGIDQEVFNPASDPRLLANYSPSELGGKAICKRKLMHEVGFPGDGGLPLFGVVSRLSSQKGMDMILEVADKILEFPARLIVQGIGDPELATKFRELEGRRADRFRFVEKFDADFAQRVYAGADVFLMPSTFEPCGLGQLIAMRYGTVPVVRETGGLADTVTESENGFTFNSVSSNGFLRACERAVAWYRDPLEWRMLMDRAMQHDSSWTRSAAQYEKLYTQTLKERRALVGYDEQAASGESAPVDPVDAGDGDTSVIDVTDRLVDAAGAEPEPSEPGLRGEHSDAGDHDGLVLDEAEGSEPTEGESIASEPVEGESAGATSEDAQSESGESEEDSDSHVRNPLLSPYSRAV